MSEPFFEQSERDADDGLRAPELGPLRAAAGWEELAQARSRMADGLGNPLRPGDPRAPLARDVAQALTEAGLTLHNCAPHHPRYRLGGVCLLPVPGGDDPGGQGGDRTTRSASSTSP
jgi:hypothetical protein